MKNIFLLMTLTIILISGCSSQTAPPEPATDNGLIAFYSDRDGNLELYTMRPDGTQLQRLTNNSFTDDSPAWSPDGARLVFLSDRQDLSPGRCAHNCFYQLYLINADGSGERALVATDFSAMHPDWHPDGNRISFDSEANLQGSIYLVNTDGSQMRLLIEDGFWPDWSPDGSRLVFASARDGNVELYTANADGTNQQRLTSNPRMEYFPAWSPDGRWIAFGTVEQKQIFIIDVETGEEHQITIQGNCEDPAWSPDGSQLVYQSSSDGDFELYVINVEDVLQSENEVAPLQLTENQFGDLWPSWAPAQTSD